MSSELDAPSLGQRAAKGAAWTVVAQVAVNVLRLVGNLVSARFLDADAYGLMAIVITINTGLIMVSDVGIEQGVIYDKEGDKPIFLRTAYSLQVVRGLMLYGTALLLTSPTAWFYTDGRYLSLIPVVSLQCLFAGFISMKFAWNKRRVRSMRELALLEIGAQLSATIMVAVLAYLYRSVWALAFGAFAYAFMRMALTHVLLDGPKDGFAWDRPSIVRIVNYGRWIFVSTFITFFSLRYDVFALGKLETIGTLGLYNMALMLTSMLNTIGFQVSQTVIFPALSEASRTGSPEVMHRTFQRSQRVVLPIALWAITGLTYLGPAFFYYLYRSRFDDAGWMLQYQIGFVWFVFLTDSWVRALMAVNDNRSMAIANLVRLVVAVAVGNLAHQYFGLIGFILAMGFASLCAHVWVHIALYRHGFNAWRPDLMYTLIAIPLLALGILGPRAISAATGISAMPISIVLSVIVGVPFTAGLFFYLRRNIESASHAVIPVEA
ncbi:MAG: oligosaccharide flippase family protein [Myxococcota bacterium]